MPERPTGIPFEWRVPRPVWGWTSIAAGIGVLGFSLAPMFHPAPDWNGTKGPECSVWTQCPGLMTGFIVFPHPNPPYGIQGGWLVEGDPANLRPYLILLTAVVAVVVPGQVIAGRGASAGARWTHLTVALLSGLTISWYFYMMAWAIRYEGAGDVYREYRLRPAWGGWTINTLTAVILLCAIAIARHPLTSKHVHP